MGIEVLAAASLAVGAVSTVSQIRASRRAQDAREEAADIQKATEQTKNRLARRRAAKQERIRRAQLLNASSQTGTGASSGALGASSALGASFASQTAQQQSGILAAEGITDANTDAANAVSAGRRAAALGQLGQEFIGFAEDENLFS